MTGVVFYVASSLDGFIARADGSVDWLGYFDDDEPEEDYGYQELFGKVDIVLMGRRTYEQILGFGEWPYEGKRCVVFTHEPLAYSDERVEFVSEPAAFLRNIADDKSELTWLVGGADMAPAGLKATALGTFHTVTGLGALPSSLIAGFLWQIDPCTTFIYGAAISFISALLFIAPRDHFET